MKLFVRRQRAQALGLAAVVAVSMVGMLALVVDAGLFWETQRELQKAADNAALAGVVFLPDDQAEARGTAINYAAANTAIPRRLCSQPPTTTVTLGQAALNPSGRTIYTLTVSMECTAGFTFGRILDLLNMQIRANATAALGSLKSPNCPIPFAISDDNGGRDLSNNPVYAPGSAQTPWAGTTDGRPAWEDMARNGFGFQFGELRPLHVDNASSNSGNFHAIELGNGSGGSVFAENLAGHCVNVIPMQPGDDVTTEPGDMSGPTEQGLDASKKIDNGPPPVYGRGLVPCSGASQPALCNTSYPDPSNPHPPFELACPDDPVNVVNPDGSLKGTSKCLGIVVVVMSWIDVNGREDMTVEGFAQFYIAGWDKNSKAVWGIFVKRAKSLGELGAYDPLGTIVTRLIR